MRERAMPSRSDASRCEEARDVGRARQARAGIRPSAVRFSGVRSSGVHSSIPRLIVLLGALGASLMLAGCVGSPGESPLQFYRQITGEALEGRPLPPGMERGTPNLASVPQRPSRGPSSARAELSALLAANRAASASPLVPGAPVPDRPATEGIAAVPAVPPSPARLAPAPPLGAGPATLLLPGTQAPRIEEAAPEGPAPALTAPPAPDLAPTPSFPAIVPRGR